MVCGFGHALDVPRLELRIGDELLAAARAEADRQGEPVSALVREALTFYLGWLEAQRTRSPTSGLDDPTAGER